jgi:hypothetical protein
VELFVPVNLSVKSIEIPRRTGEVPAGGDDAHDGDGRRHPGAPRRRPLHQSGISYLSRVGPPSLQRRGKHDHRHDREVIQTDEPTFIEDRKRPAHDVVKGRAHCQQQQWADKQDDPELNGEHPRCGGLRSSRKDRPSGPVEDPSQSQCEGKSGNRQNDDEVRVLKRGLSPDLHQHETHGDDGVLPRHYGRL